MKDLNNFNNDQEQHNVDVPLTEVDTDVEDLFEDSEEKNNIDDEQFYESNDCTYDSLFLNKSSFERPESLANNDFLLQDLNQDQKDKIEQLKKLQNPLISNVVNPIAVTEAMTAMSSSKRHFVEPNDMEGEVLEETLEPVEIGEPDDAIEAVEASETIDAVEASDAIDAVEASDAIDEGNNFSDLVSTNEKDSNDIEKVLLNSNDIKTQKIASTIDESEKQQQEKQQQIEEKSKTIPMFKEIGSLRRDKTIDSPVQKRDNQNNFATKSSATNQSYTKSSATNQSYTKSSATNQSYKTVNNLSKSSDSIPTQIIKNGNQSTSEHKIESGLSSNIILKNSSIGTIEKTHPKLVLPIICIVLAVFLIIILALFSNYTPQSIYVKIHQPLQETLRPMLLAEGIVLGEERVQFAPHAGEITFLVKAGSQVTKDQKVAVLTKLDWEKQNQQNKAELMALLAEWQEILLKSRDSQVTAKNKKASSLDNTLEKFKSFQEECWEQINTENVEIDLKIKNLEKKLKSSNHSIKQNVLLQKIKECIKKCQSCKRETDIKADYDGTIQKLSYTKNVKPNSSLFTIVESKPEYKYVRIKVRKEYYAKLLPIMAEQQPFSVSIGVTRKGTIPGFISNISLRSDHTKETLCEVIVQLKAVQNIPDGDIADIQSRLTRYDKENCLQLPKSVIMHSEDCDHVFYYVLVANHIKGNQYQIEKKRVTLGLSDANNVEITTGLNGNEYIVIESNVTLPQIPNNASVRGIIMDKLDNN